MSLRIRKMIRIVLIGIINCLLVLTFYNLGLILGQIIQKM